MGLDLKELISSLKKESLRGLYECPTFAEKVKQLLICSELANDIISIQDKDNDATFNSKTQTSSTFDTERFSEFKKWLISNDVNVDKIGFEYIKELNCNGVICKMDIPKGQLAFQVPKKTMILQSALLSSKTWQEIYSREKILQSVPHLMLCLALLSEKMLGKSSFFEAYINILPTEFPTLPMMWSIDDIEMLKDTTAQEPGINRKFNCWSYYCHIVEMLETAATSTKPARLPVLVRKRELFTLSSFTWALCISMTRQNRIPVVADKAGANGKVPGVNQELALIPVFDMCNHEPGLGYSSSYNMKSEALNCEASRDFQTGEEFRIFYGRRPNAELLVYSGFVLPIGENEFESFVLELKLPSREEDPLFPIKKLLLVRTIHPSKTKLKLGKSPYFQEDMETAKAFARIASLTKEEASEILKRSTEHPLLDVFSAPINERNEKQAGNYLSERISRMREEKKEAMESFKKKWAHVCEGSRKILYDVVLRLHEGEYDCLQVDVSN